MAGSVHWALIAPATHRGQCPLLSSNLSSALPYINTVIENDTILLIMLFFVIIMIILNKM